MSGIEGALATIAGSASIGIFLDALVRMHHSELLLIGMWFKLEAIKPETLAQQEAYFAFKGLSGLTGSGMWSRDRLRFLLSTLLFALVLGALLYSHVSWLNWHSLVSQDTLETFAPLAHMSWTSGVLSALFALLGLSVSISITQWFLKKTSTLSPQNRVVVAILFPALLLTQLWVSAIVAFVVGLAFDIIGHLVQLKLIYTLATPVPGSIANSYNALGAMVYGLIVIIRSSFVIAPFHALVEGPFRLPGWVIWMGLPGENAFEGSLAVASVIIGYTGSLIRMVIALIFMVSYVSLPVRHRVVRNLEGLVETKEPVFTIVFGLAGTLAIGLQLIINSLRG